MIAPSVGGHHNPPFAIFEVDKGAGTRFTASSPCGRQEQVPASDDIRAIGCRSSAWERSPLAPSGSTPARMTRWSPPSSETGQ